VAHRTRREKRLALVVGALALVAGTPTILVAAGIKNRWVLAVTTAAAAVVVVFSVLAQRRYEDLVQRRDEHELHFEGGCLMLPNKRLPAVRDIRDPVALGVHRAAAPAATAPDGQAITDAPSYIPRDIDDELREQLLAGGFVLLAGDSTAGKSRAAFEAMRDTLADHVLIWPSVRDAIAVAVDRAAQERRCVLWLDDLERYLGAGGLNASQVGRLLSGEGHHRVIVATIRVAERTRITTDAPGDDAGRQALRDIRHVLDLAHLIRVDRMFTSEELKRAEIRKSDSRIAEAIGHAGSYGIAEYLASGPELLDDWQDARTSSEGPHCRGAALVAAAIDIRRAGYTSPIPRALLDRVHEQYLADPEHVHAPREPADDAWAWATRPRRATTALLRPAGLDLVEVFDYLVDAVQWSVGPRARVPESVVRDAIDSAGPADVDSLALIAYVEGRYVLAEHAWRRAYQAKISDPAFGSDHPDTLASRSDLGRVLRELGRLEEAEAEYRAVLAARVRVLGSDDPLTLASRSDLADLLGGVERPEAERLARIAYATHRRVSPQLLPPWEDATEQERREWVAAIHHLTRVEGIADAVPTQALTIQAENMTHVFNTDFTAGRQGALAASDEFASSHHALFQFANGFWYIEDLGSTNGTWLNGRPVFSTQRLKKGDKIRIGHTAMTVVSA
jgi:hypothetical protein